MIAAITMAARVIGFGRQLVFNHTVGVSCLGTAYTTANMVPNLVYDIVLGGALTAVVIPVLAGDTGRSSARQTSAALLTWTVLLLAPASAVIAVFARPLVSVLLGSTRHCPRAEMVPLGARMLAVFAPQILLYGLAVVLYGILQSRRRFTAPALAPVVSSLVVIGAYLWFRATGRAGINDLDDLPGTAWIILGVGTTAGVAALVLTPAVPLLLSRRSLRLRPTLRFPDGAGARIRSLAAAGVATLIAQDASVAVVIVLANSRGGGGALVLYGSAWAVFFLPYAVLAVPVATSAFPELSEQAGGDAAGFARTSAAATRAVLIASWLGAAAMTGAAIPLARVFTSTGASELAVAFGAFAPGLVGYGLIATLSRVLYASGKTRAAGVAVSAGWLLVIVADLLIVPFVRHPHWVVPALGAGTSIGLTGAGIALVILVRRHRGAAALAGCGRAALAGLAGALAGAAAGWGMSNLVRVHGTWPNAAVTVLAVAVVLAVFAVVVLAADGGDLRAVAGRVLRR
jgi:putative peptidoglycan lipid II flippase